MVKNNKTYYKYYLFLFIFSITINLLFLYNIILFNNIENKARIILLLISIVLTISFNIFLSLTHNKKLFTSISIIFFIYLIILTTISYNLKNIYIKLDKLTKNKDYYSSSIITLTTNKNNNILKIDKIGIINNQNNIEGYIIPQEIITNNNLNIELIEYDNYQDMINDLIDKKIDYIFLPTNYKTLLENTKYNNLEKLKIIYTQKKEKEKIINDKKLTEPFTILLMGVDSEDNNITTSTYNGDALMILTFNPNNMNTTILSIPRDTYLNITCMNRKNKITHSAQYNESCIIDTLNNTFNLDIDYYIKIDFKGLVDLVDNIGGIDVDVPYSFCESNSNRLWGPNTIYVKEGLNHLNGEQALALARNRHPWPEFCPEEYTNYYSSDIIRGENQQKVLNAIIEKIKNIKSINTIYNLLDIISNNVITNLNTNNILSFYNTSKNINKIKIQKLYLNGYDEYIYDYDYIHNIGTKLTLYNYIPYQESINELSKIMNDNLNSNLNSNLNINNEILGDIEGEKYINLMPNFIGKTYYEVQNFCNNHNIKLNINYISGNNIGTITNQSINELTDLEYVDNLTIDLVNNKTEEKKELPKNSNSNNKESNNININNNAIKDNTIKENTNNELDPIINEIFN